MHYKESYFSEMPFEKNAPFMSGIEMPTKLIQIAELYLRMKAAADKAKDYHRASWFYFNEFELKRRAIIEDIKNSKGVNRYKRYAQRLLYDTYILLAGYGEKPRWSLDWFAILTLVSTLLYMSNGLKKSLTAPTVSYSLSINWDGLKHFVSLSWLSDFFTALFFTITRAIPVSYLPGLKNSIVPADRGLWTDVLSFSVSVSLILLLVFTGVGLKRHFRRF